MKHSTRSILSGGVVVIMGVSARAAYDGLINEGYEAEQIGECLPGYASREFTTNQEAQALLNDYQSLEGRGYMDTAAVDDIPFQTDNINGIGEMVCQLTTEDGVELVFTSGGQAMAHDAVLNLGPQGS